MIALLDMNSGFWGESCMPHLLLNPDFHPFLWSYSRMYNSQCHLLKLSETSRWLKITSALKSLSIWKRQDGPRHKINIWWAGDENRLLWDVWQKRIDHSVYFFALLTPSCYQLQPGKSNWASIRTTVHIFDINFIDFCIPLHFENEFCYSSTTHSEQHASSQYSHTEARRAVLMTVVTALSQLEDFSRCKLIDIISVHSALFPSLHEKQRCFNSFGYPISYRLCF